MTGKMKLEYKDVQILNIVKDDARITYKELADKIDLTESPTYTRLQTLIKNGIIKRVKADLDLESVGYKMPIVMLFKVPEGKADEFVGLVDKHKAVIDWYELKPDIMPYINYHVLLAVGAFRSFRHCTDFQMLLNTELTSFMELQSWSILREWTGTFEIG